MRRALLFIPVVLTVILGIVLFQRIGKDPTQLESAQIGKPVPAFELADLLDPSISHGSEALRGKGPFLLNVWGTWCPSCRDEHPDLIRLAEQQGVRIVGLNYKDERPLALQWLERLGNPYALSLFDPDGKLGFDLGVYGAPETFVIDGDGIIRYRHVGVVNQKVWSETLQPLMQQLGGQG
ncbi:MAG: DsbE family thiol:disulfide interchange protein [Pseudomonadales bacterium]|nr:DsbE family thiol:disulfide interchange protein [Pseudomonadales bacterium]